MNALLIYDSMFGNTEKIALAVAEGMGPDTKTVRATDLNPDDLVDLDVLVIGSPVHGGRASENMLRFFETLKKDSLKDVKVAAFDTRFEKNTHGLGLKMVMNMIGFAAGKILNTLENKGAKHILDPEGFFVMDKEGPLKEGEIDRAKLWGKSILNHAR
jgi:flavodoxin